MPCWIRRVEFPQHVLRTPIVLDGSRARAGPRAAAQAWSSLSSRAAHLERSRVGAAEPRRACSSRRPQSSLPETDLAKPALHKPQFPRPPRALLDHHQKLKNVKPLQVIHREEKKKTNKERCHTATLPGSQTPAPSVERRPARFDAQTNQPPVQDRTVKVHDSKRRRIASASILDLRTASRLRPGGLLHRIMPNWAGHLEDPTGRGYLAR